MINLLKDFRKEVEFSVKPIQSLNSSKFNQASVVTFPPAYAYNPKQSVQVPLPIAGAKSGSYIRVAPNQNIGPFYDRFPAQNNSSVRSPYSSYIMGAGQNTLKK